VEKGRVREEPENRLTFRYASVDALKDERIVSFLDPILKRISSDSEFGVKNKAALEKLALLEKIKLLQSQGYGALIAFEKENPVGLIAFQDHSDKSRHAFLVHTLPERRKKGIALDCLREFVQDGFKKGIVKFRFSSAASGRTTRQDAASLLQRFEEKHAAKLGFKVDSATGFIEKT
jgi:ribosomal protein S18 acetylase RimI-like enzyme